MLKKQELKIIISHDNDNDNLEVSMSASANLALGMIARARFELNKLEIAIHNDLTKKQGGNQ